MSLVRNTLWMRTLQCYRPRGPMDKASDFESEDCGFDPHRGQFYFHLSFVSYHLDIDQYDYYMYKALSKVSTMPGLEPGIP